MTRHFRSFRGEEDETAAAARKGRENAERAQRQYDLEQEREYARKYPPVYDDEASLKRRPSGHWLFKEILSEDARLVGWDVTLDGRKVGIVILRDDDLWVLSTSGDSNALRKAGIYDDPALAYLLDNPTPQDIMAAFLKLYPGGAREARSLPRGRQNLLPADASPFGPSRDWSED